MNNEDIIQTMEAANTSSRVDENNEGDVVIDGIDAN